MNSSPRHTPKVVGIASCVPWLALAWLNPIIGGLADQSGTFARTVMCVACVPLCGSAFGWLWPEKPT